jgi:hypothetical protein
MKAVALFLLLAGVASAQITAIPAATGGGSGETNTSGDQGGGLSVRATTPKVGVRLDFRTFASADTQVLTVTNTGDLINWTAITNAANGLLKLDAGGLVPNARLQTTIASDTSGNAATATALAANGANCSAGQAAGGVDASGAAEDCFTPAGGSGNNGLLPALDTGTDTLTAPCPSSQRCVYKFGGGTNRDLTSAAPTIIPSASTSDHTAYLWVNSAGTVIFEALTGTTFGTCTGATCQTAASPAFPTDGSIVPLAVVQISGGNFVAASLVDWRPTGGSAGWKLAGGSNVTITPSGDNTLTIAATGGSGGSPGGSATELQYRGGASTFSAIAGTSYDSTADTNKGRLYIGTNDRGASDQPVHMIRRAGDAGTDGRVRFQVGPGGNGAAITLWDSSGTVGAGLEWETTGVDTGKLVVNTGAVGIGARNVEFWPGGLVIAKPMNAASPSYTCNANTAGAYATTRQAGAKAKVWFCIQLASDAYQWETITTAP